LLRGPFELFLACVGCVVDALAIAQLRDALFEVVVALYEVLQFLVAGFQFGPVEQFGLSRNSDSSSAVD